MLVGWADQQRDLELFAHTCQALQRSRRDVVGVAAAKRHNHLPPDCRLGGAIRRPTSELITQQCEAWTEEQTRAGPAICVHGRIGARVLIEHKLGLVWAAVSVVIEREQPRRGAG